MIKKVKAKVKSNKLIADEIFELKLAGEFKPEEFLPGRFLHIRCAEAMDPLLRRPMSLCDLKDSGDELVVLYRREGKGTKHLAAKNCGDELDMLAPLGVEFPTEHLDASKTILLVGGGIGVPPLYYLGRKLKQKGLKIKTVIGFNSAKDVFYAEKFAELGETWVSTVDGSYQNKNLNCFKGFAPDILAADAKEKIEWDSLYSCGPNIMLAALQKLVSADKDAYISMEERMACGVGACLACVCPVDAAPDEKNYARVCTEGPVFKLHHVKF